MLVKQTLVYAEAMADYVSRAQAAWYRAGWEGPALIGREASAGGKRYVALWSQSAATGIPVVVAVYRIRNDGILKGLKRWPRELEGGDRA
jgi:hypothetical protein